MVLLGTSAEGLADHVGGQAGNPLREPVAAGQANYGPYRNRPMVRGYGHGYYNTHQANYGPYRYRPMVHANGVGYYNTYEESMQARYPYLHHYPYYELPPMYFPQAAAPPRNAKDGEPDLCRIM
ncbi:hypothetical protein OIU84_023457 [Salix udensis]|uniref:Uncharacterized protein n=1 Tax=Salix udensis TaxID=889485 RepID=A0AAD6KRC6_9ROSI|nr:hypothetical protein OIU84_023457 [Salix udensis]